MRRPDAPLRRTIPLARFAAVLLGCAMAAAPGAAGAAESVRLMPARHEDGLRAIRPANAFADRDRRRFATGADPCAAAVGLVDADDVDKVGTGTVVLHERIVLTAAHVVLDLKRGRPARRVVFRLGYDRGRAHDIGATVAAVGTTRPGTVETARDDWAILVLDHPAPARPVALASLNAAALAVGYRGALSLIGYSGDRADGERASIEQGCSVLGERHGRLLHDCSTAEGASGAALMLTRGEACTMVGLVDGAVSPRPVAGRPFHLEIANSAVMPRRLRDRLDAALDALRGGTADAAGSGGGVRSAARAAD